MMIAIAPEAHRYGYYAFSAFCFLIAAVALVEGRVQQFFGSLLGVAVFAVGLWYLVGEWQAGKIVGSSPGDSSLLGAVAFLVVFGLPGLRYCLLSSLQLRRAHSTGADTDRRERRGHGR